jgi:hypothetical protein
MADPTVKQTLTGHGVRNVFLPPTPVDIAGQAGLAGAEKQGLLLSDQDYYDRFIRPEEARLRQDAIGKAAAASRASRFAQQDFLTAQGLGGSTVANAAQRALVGPFQRAQARALDAARIEAEELRRRKFAERQQKLSDIQQGVSLAGSLESQIASAVLSAIPFTQMLAPVAAAGTTAKTIPYSMAPEGFLSQANMDAPALRTVDFSGGASAYSPSRDRGGGGSDFYRTYGGA